MKKLFENVFMKMGVILLLIVILLIPAKMVENLIQERENRQLEAVKEISDKHAGAQNVSGPVLTIPYVKKSNVLNPDGTHSIMDQGYLHILPNNLAIDGEVTPETRKRGLYEVVVYGTELDIQGSFRDLTDQLVGLRKEDLKLNEAFFTIGISDLKGVVEHVNLTINGNKVECQAGLKTREVINKGLVAYYPLDSLADDLSFQFSLNLNGSSQLAFKPIGKETTIHLDSKWKDPSFMGNTLPFKRTVSDNGFSADWKLLDINRAYPQSWKKTKYSIDFSEVGVTLMQDVGVYQKSMRVAKYGILFIIFTFVTFFFVEIIHRILIHPVQYVLVGSALILFYVLMLSFSEQMYFDWAYLIAAIMTISLVTLYCTSILKSRKYALMTGAILSILYTFIFVIIQLQEFALLFGSIGVFMVIAVTMYLSRKVDWFGIDEVETEDVE